MEFNIVRLANDVSNRIMNVAEIRIDPGQNGKPDHIDAQINYHNRYGCTEKKNSMDASSVEVKSVIKPGEMIDVNFENPFTREKFKQVFIEKALYELNTLLDLAEKSHKDHQMREKEMEEKGSLEHVKEETRLVENRLTKKINELKCRINSMKFLNINEQEQIEVGAYVTLIDFKTGLPVKAYIIGNEVCYQIGYNGNATWMLSINSPLGKALRGLKTGDSVNNGQYQFRIMDIL